jgi:hypothetical protein
MTKRIVLTLTSAVAVAAIAAPAAGAATASFSGSCTITGVSTFDPPLTGTSQIIRYDFKSGPPADGAADETKCSGTLNGAQVTDVPVKASVAGEGDLSCESGESTTPGKGTLAFPDGSTFPFDFTFTAVLTEVDFVATFPNGAQTTGHASFLEYAPPTSAFDCSPAGSGIEALGFGATTDESSAPAQGTRPDPQSQGDDGAGDKGPTAAERRRACIRKAKKKFKNNKKKRKRAIRRCKRRFS